MTISIEQIYQILNNGSISEKIEILSQLTETDNNEIISEIIKMLDDPEIRVRGEAFSTLVINKKNISKILMDQDRKSVV